MFKVTELLALGTENTAQVPTPLIHDGGHALRSFRVISQAQAECEFTNTGHLHSPSSRAYGTIRLPMVPGK